MNSPPLGPEYAERVRQLAARPPHLTGMVRFLPARQGGRTGPVPNGMGCTCLPDPRLTAGHDARLLFDTDWVPLDVPVATRFFFLGGESAAASYRRASRFMLWDAKVIGEAWLPDGT